MQVKAQRQLPEGDAKFVDELRSNQLKRGLGWSQEEDGECVGVSVSSREESIF